jgi:hypothetical protein
MVVYFHGFPANKHNEEEYMERKTMMYGVRVAAVSAIFGVGFLCGSVTQKNADAQMGDIGSDMMKKAAGSGGMLGSAAELGTSINEMQQHVNGLQKNLEVLKKIKGALGK